MKKEKDRRTGREIRRAKIAFSLFSKCLNNYLNIIIYLFYKTNANFLSKIKHSCKILKPGRLQLLIEENRGSSLPSIKLCESSGFCISPFDNFSDSRLEICNLAIPHFSF